jgi:WD40 repeat protein
LSSSQREYDPIIYLWDLATGEVSHKFVGHHGNVGDIAFTSDGKTLIAAGGNRFMMSNKGCFGGFGYELRDNRVIAWDVQTEEQLWAQEGPIGGSFDIEVSNSGDSVAILNSHCKDNYVWIYDISTGQIQKKIYSGEYARWSDIEFSPNGENILVRGYSLLSLDVQSGEEAGGEDLQGRYIIYPDSIDVAPESELGVAIRDDDIYFFCFEPKTCSGELPTSEFVDQIAFVPGKQMLLGLGEYRGVVSVWGSSGGEALNGATTSAQPTQGSYPPKEGLQENAVYLADLLTGYSQSFVLGVFC